MNQMWHRKGGRIYYTSNTTANCSIEYDYNKEVFIWNPKEFKIGNVGLINIYTLINCFSSGLSGEIASIFSRKVRISNVPMVSSLVRIR